MKIVLVLLFIISLVISSRIDGEHFSFEPVSPEPKSRFAMLDDVQLLAHGLLQLGRGLKDFAIKTKDQMDDIFRKLNIFDQSFYEISQQANEIKEEEEELKNTTLGLQAHNEEIRNISLELNSKIEILSQEKNQLQDKVEKLEEKLTKLFKTQLEIQEPEEIASLKNFTEQQENHLRSLLNIVQVQYAQIGKQQKQIQVLEEKLNSPGFQDNTHIFALKKDETRHITLNTTATVQDYKGNATDCTWFYNRGERSNGIYSIKPCGSNAFNVYCEMKTESSWTFIQSRSDGSIDFNQTWETYINGFGNLSGEFWLGLQKIYSIVNQANYILRIELEDWRANKRYIEYTFTTGGPEKDYAVLLSRITGNIPNALPEQKEVTFSTKDHSNNTERKVNCPEDDSGGWWYSACEETSLNGKYIKPSSKGKLEKKRGLYWKPQKGRPYLLKSTKLMIHPTDFENFD
ncbi:LOW QUALITY PROTEIN: angiopoietin-related protein 3 [Rhineura floridana]|uniref:LOW QUALITY PROTEIN: angiopoietin-related protein 3 n=1 Tax=Rhineura floridana TaxID=261503 RepID=UPI002AC833A9|nr:LOW QUALITY PROTEIN: angiopoietin-related protein 3 [Rhineura floridana]